MNKFILAYKSFSILTKSEKRGVLLLLLVSIINSLIQTLGVISIMPFIALIADPSIAQENQYILLTKEYLSIDSHQHLLMLFGVITFMALLLSNAIIVLNYWISLAFFNQIGGKLTYELLDSYLSKLPHAFYKYKVSDLTKKIHSEVDRVLIGTQLSVISLITDIIILCIIFSLLLFINIWVSIITAFTLMAAYFLVYNFLSNKINKLGEEFIDMETEEFSNLRQALDMFKEIRIAGNKSYFVNKFRIPTTALYKNSTNFHVLTFLPTQVIEVVSFAVILIISTYIATATTGGAHAITTISVFAFAAYRFIPILKSIFDELEEIIYVSPLLETLLKEYSEHEVDASQTADKTRLNLTNKIQFKDVSFRYSADKKPIFENFNISIPINELTCITGKSGIGKSTLLDLLLGLISPQSGQLLLDNNILTTNNIRQWQNNIGYVPQHIQLLEASVIENICFGIDENLIDLDRVIEVSKIACIHDHIVNNLNDGYQSIIGNGGSALSGGEKQRIGIARCLYNNPQVLIFDEATNELDLTTEAEVLDNIKQLSDKTIIFVTHKPSVISQASNIINLPDILSATENSNGSMAL